MTECFEVPTAVTAAGWTPPTGTRLTTAPLTDADALRTAFRRHAGAVAVITAGGSAGPVGFTASSLASVSTEPPLLSFNIALTSSSWPAVSIASHLGVHVLADDQEELAQRFATKGADRFAAPTRWQPGPHGVPVLDGAAAALVVGDLRHVPAGDHVIVVARVLHASARDGAAPLIHHDGDFHTLARKRSGWRGRRG